MKNNLENHMKQKVKYYVSKAFKILFFILLALILAFLLAYIAMRLWNWLMPEIFGLPQLDYWQTVGIFILAKIFFGFGGGNGPGKSGTSKKGDKPKKCRLPRRDFSDWQHYDAFWEETGEQAYKDYLNRMKKEE